MMVGEGDEEDDEDDMILLFIVRWFVNDIGSRLILFRHLGEDTALLVLQTKCHPVRHPFRSFSFL